MATAVFRRSATPVLNPSRKLYTSTQRAKRMRKYQEYIHLISAGGFVSVVFAEVLFAFSRRCFSEH